MQPFTEPESLAEVHQTPIATSEPPKALTAAELPKSLSLWALALIAALFAVNAPVVVGLFRTWTISYAEMGHGFLAPPLALYIIWNRKEDLSRLPLTGHWAGFALLACCAPLVAIAHMAQWIFISQAGLWLMLLGAIWFLAGAPWLRALRFPLFLLLLSVPPPSFAYTRLTFEMQLLASRLGEFGLEMLGFSVLREGNILQMVGERLSVADACSGIRSLATLLFFVTIYSYFMVERNSHRFLIVLSAIPVAILANGLRIVSTGVLSQYDRQLAHGVTHEISGYITLIGGGLICILLEKALIRRTVSS